MSQNATVTKRGNPGFGHGYRGRKKAQPQSLASAKSDNELVAEFLKSKQVTRYPTRFADGAIPVSGYYDF